MYLCRKTKIYLFSQMGTERILADTLDGVPITLVGDDWALTSNVAQRIGQRLGWFPVDPVKVRRH